MPLPIGETHDLTRLTLSRARIKLADVACPYFYPTGKSELALWSFPQRLPLGAGYHGHCTASKNGSAEAHLPSEMELKDFCNLGHAGGCGRMPSDRHCDAVRFSRARAAKNESGDRIVLHYVCDLNHAPVEYGQLEYDLRAGSWKVSHPDSRIQRQAECYLAACLENQGQQTANAKKEKSKIND
ncbi:MAG TPA: hypothetical protein VKZ53_31295 [Candidatus Angelobacter sp.]|nr:hypothetical protein [Candidatus Angelobacter sp.]